MDEVDDLALWADAIKYRDGSCLICGSKKELNAHHVFSKTLYPEISLDLRNGTAMCYVCHMFYHKLFSGIKNIEAINIKTLLKFAYTHHINLNDERLDSLKSGIKIIIPAKPKIITIKGSGRKSKNKRKIKKPNKIYVYSAWGRRNSLNIH